MKANIVEKLKRKFLKIWIVLTILTISNIGYLNSNEIIRDQVFEFYGSKIINEITNISDVNIRLIKDIKANAYVINNKSIYITTGLLKEVNENAMIGVILHELGHIKNNHIAIKKMNISDNIKKNKLNSILAIASGAALMNPEIIFGLPLFVDEANIQNFLSNSRKFENEADDFMIKYMTIKNVDLNNSIDFLKYLLSLKNNNNYRQSHPSIKNRISRLNEINKFDKNKKNFDTKEFQFVKAKYAYNSNNNILNNFFKEMDKGNIEKVNNVELEHAINYELFKNNLKNDDTIEVFKKNILFYDNSFVKLEFINYLIDNSYSELLTSKLDIFKNNLEVKNEFYFLYIMGKAYDYLKNTNLSYFYLCNFNKKIKNKKLINYYCPRYESKYISILDLDNEINDSTN